MSYNLSCMDVANNTLHVVTCVNNESNLWFFSAGLLVFASIIFITGSIRYDMEDVLIADGLLTVIVGGLMWSIGLIKAYVLILPSLLLFGALIYKIWGRSD